MKKINYLAALLFAATLLATPACNKDDDEGIEIEDTLWIQINGYNFFTDYLENVCKVINYPQEEYNFFAQKAADLFKIIQSKPTTKSYSPTDINSDDYSIGNFVYNGNSDYEITQEKTYLPAWDETAYGGSYLNTQAEIVEFQGKTYLLVVISKRGHQPGDYFGDTGGGEAFLKWGTLYESKITSHKIYRRTDEYVWLVHEIKLQIGAEIIYPLIVNHEAKRSYTNPIIITSKKGLVQPNWQKITKAGTVYGTLNGTEVKCSSPKNDDYNLTNDLSCVGYCKTWSSSIYGISLGASGNAWEWFANRSKDAKFSTWRNGSTEPPREGDIVAMHGKSNTGHVVVINYVDYKNGKAYVTHQNAGQSSKCPPIGCVLDLICENGTYTLKDNTIRNYTIDGWIRSAADTSHFVKPKQNEAPEITDCYVNDILVDKNSCISVKEGEDIKITALAENNNGEIVISFDGTKYTGDKSYTEYKVKAGEYKISVWSRYNNATSETYDFTITVNSEAPIPSITQCLVNNENVDKNACYKSEYGKDIDITAIAESYDCDIILFVNGKKVNGASYTIPNPEPGDYMVEAWTELDGKQSEKYSFSITVNPESAIPGITQCFVNEEKIGRNACYKSEYGKYIDITAIAESTDCNIKISVNGKKVNGDSYSILNPEPGDYMVEAWTEKDGKQSNKYEFSITVNEAPKKIIESNISSGGYVSQIDDFVRMYITYNKKDFYLHGSAGAYLDVKYVYDGKKIKIIGEKSTGSFSQKGTAVLFKDGFETIEDSKPYYPGDKNVTFEIDPESITDKTEFRIALIIQFTTEQGKTYPSGYYSAPVILNREGGDTERSYSINPSVGNTVPNPSSNRTYTIKDNWDDQNDFSNNFKKHYVENISGCNASVKVLRISGDKITLRISKNEGFSSQGRIIVYEGTSMENIWFGNLLAEKSYNIGNSYIDITFDVSHLTRKSQFGILILGTKPWDDNELHGYYSGSITVTPR